MESQVAGARPASGQIESQSVILNAIFTTIALVVFAAGWAWLAVVGIPNIIQGVQEVRTNWDNPDFWPGDDNWSHPDDDDYWDNELHSLLIEEQEPLDTWEFLNEQPKDKVFETFPDWQVKDE